MIQSRRRQSCYIDVGRSVLSCSKICAEWSVFPQSENSRLYRYVFLVVSAKHHPVCLWLLPNFLVTFSTHLLSPVLTFNKHLFNKHLFTSLLDYPLGTFLAL